MQWRRLLSLPPAGHRDAAALFHIAFDFEHEPQNIIAFKVQPSISFYAAAGIKSYRVVTNDSAVQPSSQQPTSFQGLCVPARVARVVI